MLGAISSLQLTPEDYVLADNALKTTEELTIDNIEAKVRAWGDTEEACDGDEKDEDEGVVPMLTALPEAELCIEKLRQFFQSKDGEVFFSQLDSMEAFIDKQRVESFKQTVITDSFASSNK